MSFVSIVNLHMATFSDHEEHENSVEEVCVCIS